MRKPSTVEALAIALRSHLTRMETKARLFESRLVLSPWVRCSPRFLFVVFKSVTAANSDDLKAAKVKLLSKNILLESTSLWMKSELKIDSNPW